MQADLTVQAAIKRSVVRITGKPIAEERRQYTPVDFAREVLGIDLAPYQSEIMEMLVEHHRVAVRAPHGVGKTAIAAAIVLWAIATFEDVKIITTASAWRQLVFYLWPEIHKWARKAKWDKVGLTVRDGKELLVLSITMPGRLALAAASDSPASMEGLHENVVVGIFDEAKTIPVGIWDAIEGAFSSGIVYVLAVSTPGETSGRFYDIHSRKPGYSEWWTRHITLAEGIAAGRINPEWVEQRRLQWGEQSAVFQNRVLGEFADSGEDSVIPLRWVELAQERWHACGGKGEGAARYGVDPAYKGEDKTAIARLVGVVLETIQNHAKEDTMQSAGRIAGLIEKNTPCAIDTIGVGAGVYDRLHELGFKGVRAVNVATKTAFRGKGGQEFRNLRSYVWWALREALDPNGDTLLALPPDDGLVGDLTAPQYEYLSDGRIAVEAKDDIRLRIGRSPDKGDAACLAWYARMASGLRVENL